jgi:hypothetical protein
VERVRGEQRSGASPGVAAILYVMELSA